MKISDRNPPGEHESAIVRGHIGPVGASSSGVSVEDEDGVSSSGITNFEGSGITITVDGHTATFSTQWKIPCRVATIGPITLATDIEAGDTVDGITLVAEDRVLVKDQADATENGIYVVGTASVPHRATDADAGAEFLGAVVEVYNGTTNGARIFICTNTTEPTLGTDEIHFESSTVDLADTTLAGDAVGAASSNTVVGLLGVAIQAWSGALSHPPTEAEVEAIVGTPVDKAGLFVGIVDSGTGNYVDTFFSTGAAWFLVPMVRLAAGGAVSPTVLSLTSAPEGGWSWFEDPRALAHGSYTYLGYNAGGNLKVAVATGGVVVATVTVHASLEYDDHDTPTFYYDPINDKLIVFYSKHVGPTVYKRVSTNTLTADPDLTGGFAAEVSLATSLESAPDRFFTYPSAVYTNNSDGDGDDILWLFWRAHVGGTAGEWHYTASDDGGATWLSAGIRLHDLTYSKIESDGVGKIHVTCSEHPDAADGPAEKIYHMYRENGEWRQSDGTGMGFSIPFTGSDMTMVWDGSGAGDLGWVMDTAVGAGNPVILFARYPSGTWSGTDPSFLATDIRAMYARWNGASWDVNEIVATGGQMPSAVGPASQGYPGGMSLDHDDPQIAYISRYVSGAWEMFKYVTADGGATFTPTQLTTGSTGKQVRPVGVRSQADLAAVWLSGTYTDYTNYSLGIKGYAP